MGRGGGSKAFALWRFGGNWVRFVKRGGGKNADREVRATGVRALSFQTVEFIDCPAVLALGLGRVAQAQG